MEKVVFVKISLRGSTEGMTKFHLVPWEIICLPVKLGGLGTKRVSEFNVSLLYKWFWRIKEDNLWVQVIFKKYRVSKGNFFSKLPRGAVGHSIWCGLTKVLQLFKLLTRFAAIENNDMSF